MDEKFNTKVMIKLTPNQMLVLKELAEATSSTISCLIRTIILDFIIRNEDRLNEIIDNYKDKKDGKIEDIA